MNYKEEKMEEPIKTVVLLNKIISICKTSHPHAYTNNDKKIIICIYIAESQED